MANMIGFMLSVVMGMACAVGCFYIGYKFGQEGKKPKRKARIKKIKCDVIDLGELFDKSSKSA